MKTPKLFALLLALILPIFAFCQDFDYEEEEEDSSRLYFGVQVGAHFPNHNTSILYSGRSSITPFGIEHIFNQPQNQVVLQNYFQFPYEISEFPIENRYQTAVEIGVNLAYQLNKLLSLNLEINAYRLKYEQFFTVAIDDPRNQLVGATFEQIPLFGEENRFYFNLGTQWSYFRAEYTNAYFSIFANMNDVRLRRNYFVIDGIEYNILHQSEVINNQKPGNLGFGFGLGTGIKFALTDHILADLYYQMIQTESNFEVLEETRGLHHSIGLRVIWN